jgi:hybrid cluster-associated redox disulfide protein
MNTQAFQAQQTVEDILKTFPHLMSVFRKHGTDCVGCFMQRFCTLQDVAETYEIELQALLCDLETCVKENNHSQRSIS